MDAAGRGLVGVTPEIALNQAGRCGWSQGLASFGGQQVDGEGRGVE